MYTGQAGLNTFRHKRLPSNASDVSTVSASQISELVGQSQKRRVSSTLISDADADPIRQAIRATAKTGPFFATGKKFGDVDQPEGAMSITEVTAAEEDVDWLRLEKPARSDVHVRVADSFDHSRLAELPAECSLLAVSSLWGLCFIGDEQSLKIFKLEKIAKQALESSSTSYAAPENHVNLASRPQWIRLAMSDRKVLVGFTDGSVDVWDVKGILSGNTTPDHTFAGLASPLLNLLPNPSPEGGLPQLVLALSASSLAVLEIGQECKVLRKLEQGFTCVAWSPKGKQFVLGKLDGSIEQYTPEGEKKADIPLPPALAADGGYSPVSISWMENDLLLVTYNTQVGSTSEPVNDQRQYMVHRQPKASPPVYSFTLFEDILPAWGLERSGNYRNIAHIRNWGTRLRHLVFLSSAPAIDVAILQGNNTSNPAEPPMWDVLRPDESARPGVPMQEDPKEGSSSDDATVLGLAIDLTSQDPIQQEMEGGEAQPDLPPAPRLLEYTSDGVLVVYNVVNNRDGAYENMIKAQDISTSSLEVQSVSSKPVAPSPSPFGLTSAKATSPVTSASGAAKPSFGFGGTTSIPSVSSGFGGANAFANASKTTTSVPAFGSNSFGISASSPGLNAPAFGATAFGQPSAFGTSTPAKSAFGTNAFGSSVAPTPATPAGEKPKVTGAFGASPAFGQSAFGAAASARPSFGSAAFGSSPSFGTSAFAKSAVASPSVESPKASTAFGFGTSSASSTSSGTNAAKAVSAFGASSAFGSSPAFGQSGFGKISAVPKEEAESSKAQSSTTASQAEASPFSLGGFGDMLNDETKKVEAKEDSMSLGESGTKSTSSFIKPAQSGSFFANAAKSSPFSTPQAPDAAIPKPSSTPGIQFGQASGFGTPKPAFGTSTFGSTPAFGVSTFGATGPAQATPAPEPPALKPIQATGGFAGFSTPSKSSGSSAFSSSGGFSAFGSTKAAPFGVTSATTDSAITKPTTEVEPVETPIESPSGRAEQDQGKLVSSKRAEASDSLDDEDTRDTSQEEEEAEEVLDDETQEPEEVERDLGRDDETHETYTDSEEEEEESFPENDQSATQDDEISPSGSSTSELSSPVLVELPENDSGANDEADTEEKADTQEHPFAKGHVRKTSKVHAAAQEWENLANGSDPAEPVKNSPTKFSFDVPSSSASVKSPGAASESLPTEPEPAKSSVPNFFGIRPATDAESMVLKPSTPFSFASTPAKPSDVPIKPAFAGVGVQPPLTSALNSKPNAFGFRAPTTTPAKSSPLINASLPVSESPDVKGYDLTEMASTPSKSSKTPVAESPFSALPSVMPANAKKLPGTPESNVEPSAVSDMSKDAATKSLSQPIPVTESSPKDSDTHSGMTQAFSDAYFYLEQEMQALKLLADENESFHVASSAIQGQSPSKEDVPLAEFWYLSALDVFAQATKDTYESMVEIRKAGIELNDQVKRAMATMSKADNLSENCARYKRARTDPEFRRRLRARQLGPQQAENQIMLQASYKSAVNKLNNVEDQITAMKRKSSQARTGRMPLRPSALEDINQSLRGIEERVHRESDTLEDLSHRVERLSLLKLGEERQKKAADEGYADEESVSTPTTLSTADIASCALNAEHDAILIRGSLLKARKQPLLSDTSNNRSSALNHSTRSSSYGVKRSGAFGLDLPSAPIKTAVSGDGPPRGFAAAQLPTNGASFFNIQPVAMAGLKSSFRAANKPADKKHGPRSFSAYSPGDH